MTRRHFARWLARAGGTAALLPSVADAITPAQIGAVAGTRRRSAAGGGGFLPTDIASLAGWYIGDNAATAGGTLTAWVDSSGRSKNAGYLTGGTVETSVLNGHNTVKLGASGQVSVLDIAATIKELWLVACWNGSMPFSGYPRLVTFLNTSGDEIAGSGVVGQNAASNVYSDNSYTIDPANPQSVGSFFIINAETAISVTTKEIQIRANVETAEYAVFSDVLTSGQRSDMAAYLNTKYYP